MPSTNAHRRKGAEAGRDLYAEVTAQIVAALEAGTPPWRRPWDENKTGGPMMPQNATTGVRYRGMNVIMLGMSPLAFASGDPRWATYKQAAERGWQVRKGSHGTPGFFYKRIEVQDRDGSSADGRKVLPLLRAFTLFHASQIEGIPPYLPASLEQAPWREPEATEIIADNSGAVIRTGGDRAFYSPGTDHIQLPPTFAFRSPAAFASVKLHELAHWSGSKSRLNRDLSGRFGSKCYASEELRAELAQVMLCSELDIKDCDFMNGAAYIADWLRTLRDDKREVFRAATDAQRIADYLLAFHPAYADRARPPAPAAEVEQETTADLAEAA